LRHVACPLTVNASIRAVPEKMLAAMSLLKSGLLWNRFGDQLAITCYADALVKDVSQAQKPLRREAVCIDLGCSYRCGWPSLEHVFGHASFEDSRLR
jgi:hypothetical protein